MIDKRTLIAWLRARGYSFKGRSHRQEYWKRPGHIQRLVVPRSNKIPAPRAKVILTQAGASREEVERLLDEWSSAAQP